MKFTDNKIPKGWSMKTLGDLAIIQTGGTPRTSIPAYWNGSINWMASGEVNQKRVNHTEKKITRLGLENCNSEILPKNTVMIALAGQGKTRGTVAILDIETSCNQSLAGIRSKDENIILNEFIFYNLDSRYREIREINGDGGRGGLNLRILKNLSVSYPDSIIEQQKMVRIFSLVDEKISISSAIKEELLQLKKSLTQDFLSGHVRAG